jgi:hypothetical protein
MDRQDFTFSCDCGQCQFVVERISRKSVNRVICYCSDCQAYARYLDKAETLNSWGGSDIVQLPASCLRIISGQEQIAGLKLSSKPTIRWHAKCCNSPIANMSSPSSPALGILAASFHKSRDQLDMHLGRPIGCIHGQDATVHMPSLGTGISVAVILSAVPKAIFWALTGKGKPNPFLDELTGQIRYPVSERLVQ